MSKGVSKHRMTGLTLLELMVVIGIIAVLSAISIPLYTGYIQTSREGVLMNNIATLEIFQEDFRLRTGAYLLVAADITAIDNAIGWNPEVADGTTYVIADGGGGSYDVTATDAAGVVICRRMPQKVACP